MDNEIKIQFVEMKTKTIGPSFLKELNERELCLLQRVQQDTYPDEFNK